MNPKHEEARASFSFYPADSRALRQLTLALRDRGLDVQRTDTFRLLLHLATELEMMAHATLRLRQEERMPASDETADERFTVRMQKIWLDKLDRAVDELMRKDVQIERTYVARALVHADYDFKTLAKQAERFFLDQPDKRRRVARAERKNQAQR